MNYLPHGQSWIADGYLWSFRFLMWPSHFVATRICDSSIYTLNVELRVSYKEQRGTHRCLEVACGRRGRETNTS